MGEAERRKQPISPLVPEEPHRQEQAGDIGAGRWVPREPPEDGGPCLGRLMSQTGHTAFPAAPQHRAAAAAGIRGAVRQTEPGSWDAADVRPPEIRRKTINKHAHTHQGCYLKKRGLCQPGQNPSIRKMRSQKKVSKEGILAPGSSASPLAGSCGDRVSRAQQVQRIPAAQTSPRWSSACPQSSCHPACLHHLLPN